MIGIIILPLLLFTTLTAGKGIIYPIDLRWEKYNGVLPLDALQTGHGVYIIKGKTPAVQAYNETYPGTFYPNTKTAYISAYGKRRDVTDFQILCSSTPERFRWKHVNIKSVQGAMLDKLVIGGHETSYLYIGKIFHENTWMISKVYPVGAQWEGFWAWHLDGTDYKVNDFQILMYD